MPLNGNIPTCQDARLLLRTRATLLRLGCKPEEAERLLQRARAYGQEVGISRYLAEMLGDLANADVKHCTLVMDNSENILSLMDNIEGKTGRVLDVLKILSWEVLPTRVEMGDQVKYL